MLKSYGSCALIFLAAGLFLLLNASAGFCKGRSYTNEEKSEKKVIEQFVQEFKNKANHGIVMKLFADNFQHHFKDPALPPGRAAMLALGQSVSGAFPDVHATIEDLLADGDKVIERTTATGTQHGTFNGVPASGKKVTWTEIHIYRFENGKVAELWSEIDFLAILSQIGAFPPPPAAKP